MRNDSRFVSVHFANDFVILSNRFHILNYVQFSDVYIDFVHGDEHVESFAFDLLANT